ncbi:MAG: HAMP domain-containing histidine kinase [Planctomycetes bacterium]|nr:HAMP domain-containing histidine kinase [Planctomycetota bacterium]
MRTKSQAYAQLSSQSRMYVEIERLVAELQRESYIFVAAGHTESEKNVYEVILELDDLFVQVISGESNKEKHDVLHGMREHLARYSDNFKSVVVERNLKSQLVNQRLRSISDELEGDLERCIRGNTAHKCDLCLKLEPLVYQISNNTLLYFQNLQQPNLTKAIEALNGARQVADRHLLAPPPHGKCKIAEKTSTMCENYHKVLLRAKQAVRSYLYISSVVMAGEISELLYHSNQLKDEADKDQVMQLSLLQSFLTYTERFSFWLVIIAALLGTILSFKVAQSIVQPMEGITNTLKELAAGSLDVEVPALSRHDEIGDMARAANIFKMKNQETERLLKTSQELTKTLQEKESDLIRSNEELEQFVYTVSHDLKTPLVTSMGFIGILKEQIAVGDISDLDSPLDRIVKSNERMSQLISDLLELSRVGRLDMDMCEVDMNLLLSELQDNIKFNLERANFSLEVRGPFPVIYANESRMLQVFENLINNALKYAQGKEENSILIDCESTSDNYIISVCDKGPGIAREFHEKIFALFVHLDAHIEGTGVGLAVVKKVMTLHHGKVWVESSPGEGATFKLSFPKNQQEVNSSV